MNSQLLNSNQSQPQVATSSSALAAQHAKYTPPKRNWWGKLTSAFSDPSNSRQLNNYHYQLARQDKILENQKARAFSERMLNKKQQFAKNAVYWRMKDLERSGINPMLAAWGQGAQLPNSSAPNTSSNFNSRNESKEDGTMFVKILLSALNTAVALSGAGKKRR